MELNGFIKRAKDKLNIIIKYIYIKIMGKNVVNILSARVYEVYRQEMVGTLFFSRYLKFVSNLNKFQNIDSKFD